MRFDPVRHAGSILLLVLALALLASPATAATRTATQMRVDPVAAVNWGDRANVYAYLTLTDGVPLGNVHVDLHINGEVSGGRTDASGKASFNPHTPTIPGSYVVTVTFNGSSTALPSEASTRLTVKPRLLTIYTMPAQQGLPFVAEGKEFFSDANGIAQTVVAPNYDETIMPEAKSLKVTPGVEERFARWRTHNGALYATYEMYYDISLTFVDLAGNKIDPARVASVVFKSAIGESITVKPTQPFTVIGQRVVVLASEFQAKDITYAAQDVLVDGSSVVHVAQQRYTPSQQRVWKIKLLFYSAHFSVRDALFGFPIDAIVAVTYPDGREVNMPTKDGELSLVALARGDYHVAARGWGISFSRPVALSRDQQVELKFISYLDAGVVVAGVLLVALGLVALGRPGHAIALRRRLRRRPPPVPLPPEAGAEPVATAVPSRTTAAGAPTSTTAGSVSSGPRPLVDSPAEGSAPAPAATGAPATQGAAPSAAGRPTRVIRSQAAPATEPLPGRLKEVPATTTSSPETPAPRRPQATPATEPLQARLQAARLQAARASGSVATKVQATRVREPQATLADDAPTASATEAPAAMPAHAGATTTANAAGEGAATKPGATRSVKPMPTRQASVTASTAAKPVARTEKPTASASAEQTTTPPTKPAASRTPRTAAATAAKPAAPAAAKPAAPPAPKPAGPAATKPAGNGASERLASRAKKPANGEYVVRRGDTLRSIAAEALGDADAWEQILRANPDVDFDPDRIPPGIRLKVR